MKRVILYNMGGLRLCNGAREAKRCKIKVDLGGLKGKLEGEKLEALFSEFFRWCLTNI